MPTACMKAYRMVVPTNLKPRFFKSFDKASETSVRAGTSLKARRRFTTGLPPTKPQT